MASALDTTTVMLQMLMLQTMDDQYRADLERVRESTPKDEETARIMFQELHLVWATVVAHTYHADMLTIKDANKGNTI